ncbi:MAG: GDSL-type esterase/lipase family protein [Acidobacteriota bacterium]
MRKKAGIALLIFGFCFLSHPVKGENKENLIRGQLTSPLINLQGELQYFFISQKSKINLAAHGMAGGKQIAQNILPFEGICPPVIKEDPNNRIQFLWVVNKEKTSEVFIGFFENSELSECRILHQERGTIHSLDFCFDQSNHLWAVWSLRDQSREWVIVKNKRYNQHWILNSSDYSEIQKPKILVDRTNRIWVFWTGIQDGREEVFSSFFNGNNWSASERINKSDQFPHIFLDAEIGPEGLPWLVWSVYDGEDYEINVCRRTLSGWSEEESITDNVETDLFPDINMVWGRIPMIVWSRSYQKENEILCRFKEGDHWSEEKRLIKGDEGVINSPQAVTEQGKIGLVWEAEQVLHSEVFYFSDLKEKQEFIPDKIIKKTIINPALQDNIYIGFGDSITYGYIDSTPHPDKGYIPRLERMLNSAFGNSEVMNQGSPSEITAWGLNRISDVLSEQEGRYLLLMEGTNDVITSAVTMDTAAFNLEEMAKECLDFGVFPSISTIIPRDDQWWYVPFFKQRLYTLNKKIREIPGELKIPFVDMFNEFYYYREGEQDWRSLLSQDGLHPNELGYEYMAEKWFEEIEVFPFPPTIIQGLRAEDETLFDSEPGNLIKWQENQKLYQGNIFSGYKVYRKIDSEPISYFQEVAFLRISMMVNYKQYFDNNINAGQCYCYSVFLVRKDGVEGPCSNIMVVGSFK